MKITAVAADDGDDQPVSFTQNTLTNKTLSSVGSTTVRFIPTMQAYVQLPECIDGSGHRFTLGLHHKDRSCCERCGLIRKVDS